MQRLKRRLKRNKHNSLWGVAIQQAKDYNALIEQLKSQAIDNPRIMKQILGSKTFKLLKQNKNEAF